MALTNSLNSGVLGAVDTLTAHAMVLGQGTSKITSATALTDGQLYIGSTGNDPSAALPTAANGSGLTVTPGAGTLALSTNLVAGSNITLTPNSSDTSITISAAASSSSLTWNAVVSGTADTAVAANGYSLQTGAGYVYTLPAIGVLGDTFVFANTTASSLWTVAPSAGGTVIVGNQSGFGGAVSSALGDTAEFVCVVAGATPTYQAVAFNGNINVT